MKRTCFMALVAAVAWLHSGVAQTLVPQANAGGLSIERIAWGKEIRDTSGVGHFSHRWLTPDPNEVEVLVFFPYGAEWLEMEEVSSAWAGSLPEGVGVERVPVALKISPIPASTYYVGKVLGIQDQVHAAILQRIGTKGAESLDERMEADELLAALGVPAGRFAELAGNPMTDTQADGLLRWAEHRYKDAVRTVRKRGGSGRARFPLLRINGKYAVLEGHPARTFQVANRLVRRELASRPSHEGPTNNEELTDWMAPRSGEIFRIPGSKWTGVYNHMRRELWQLDNEGDVSRSIPLRGEGDDSYFVFRTSLARDGKTYRNYSLWRYADQLRSFEGREGPQRYGAFLFADWLGAPDRERVELRFKGKKRMFAFSPDRTVEMQDGSNVVSGTWWLGAGRLYVSLGEMGTDYWPWEVAAHGLGFDVPYKSLTPWR